MSCYDVVRGQMVKWLRDESGPESGPSASDIVEMIGTVDWIHVDGSINIDTGEDEPTILKPGQFEVLHQVLLTRAEIAGLVTLLNGAGATANFDPVGLAHSLESMIDENEPCCVSHATGVGPNTPCGDH